MIIKMRGSIFEDNSELLQRERELHENKGFNGDFNLKIYQHTILSSQEIGWGKSGYSEIQPDEHNEEGQKRVI